MPDHNPYQPPSTLLAPTAAAEPVRRRLVRVVLWAAGLWALCWLLRFPKAALRAQQTGRGGNAR